MLPIDIPSLDIKSGNVSVYWSKNGQIVLLDSFDYSADYHNNLLSTSDQEGVSLERIRVDNPTNSPSNWTSAARRGTPTQPNSQRQPAVMPPDDDLIAFSADRLSPDGDGYEDFLDIAYQLPGSGYVATVTIFDSGGIPVRHLVRQSLAGTSGNLRWDGDMDDGSLARPGIYILYVEVFAPDGSVRRAKKTFAVVQQF
jgi:hypothetical protein